MTRDPRVDPRPGDVVRPVGGHAMEVIAVQGEGIHYRLHSAFGPIVRCGKPWSGYVSVVEWRNRCADATVIKVAE